MSVCSNGCVISTVWHRVMHGNVLIVARIRSCSVKGDRSKKLHRRDVLLLRNSGKSRLTTQARSITRGAQVASLTISFSKWKIRTFNFSRSLLPLIRSNFETISQIIPNTCPRVPPRLFRWNFSFLRILILLEFESYHNRVYPRAVRHVQFKHRRLKVTKNEFYERIVKRVKLSRMQLGKGEF